MENVNGDRTGVAVLTTATGSASNPKNASGTTLDSIVERVTDLGNGCTYDEAKQITAEAVRADLPRSALDHLADVFVEYTNFKAGSIRSMIKEAKNTCDDYGELHSLGETSRAFVYMLQQSFEAVTWNGDSLYVFIAKSKNEQGASEETGFFRRILPNELDAILQADFAHLSFMERDFARKEVIKQIATQLQQDDFFAEAVPGVCVANGFLCLGEDGQLTLEPHDAAQRARVKLAMTFDEKAATGWVEDGFAVALTDPIKVSALQEALGATIFNPWVSEDEARRMIILHGPRRSGKSTVLNVLQGLFPVEAVTSVPPNEWGREYSRAQLEGKALNIVTELGADMRIPAEQLKKIASCETVTARHPYGRQFTFTPTAWHWFATNELPRTTDKTNAFERRLLCLGFDRSLEDEEIDPTFVSRIFEDPSALIRWAAEGARRLLERGKFVLPHDHEEACARMQHGYNIAAIVAARIERAPGRRIWSSELKDMAAQVAGELGMMKVEVGPGELKAIVHELRARYGAERRMTAGRPFYEHVRFRREELVAEEEEVASAEESDLSDM
ncbi:DUF5906 domain-containing protein [Novosphingobium sp.]|uniref:DUF5906 domain-containing protein n=1 Tax=Novosphingobium sp. TaxID=1874826 RepID=UPI003D6D14E6